MAVTVRPQVMLSSNIDIVLGLMEVMVDTLAWKKVVSDSSLGAGTNLLS